MVSLIILACKDLEQMQLYQLTALAKLSFRLIGARSVSLLDILHCSVSMVLCDIVLITGN